MVFLKIPLEELVPQLSVKGVDELFQVTVAQYEAYTCEYAILSRPPYFCFCNILGVIGFLQLL